MPHATERDELQPPQEPGALRAYAAALLVHMLLAVALTWGVSWKSNDPDASFSAELWSATPQEAAPPLAEPPAAELTPAPAANTPTPVPTPPPPAAAAAAAEAEAEAEIALQRERQKKRQEAEALKKAELAKKAEKEKADKAKAKAQALAAAEKAEKDKARKAQESAAQAKAKAAKEAQARDTAKEQAAAEKLRQQNIARMMGMAGGTGAPDAKGTAAQASGPSASYGGRVRAKVKPNVVFTEDIAGNPVAEVEVRTSLDGTIISQRLIKSSGNKAWDDAVIKAIIRTEVLPRDVDGRVPTPLIISFRPKD